MIDADILDALRRMGLLADGETPAAEALTGGVSSDIWKIASARGTFCIKRALAKLRTEKDWYAPVSRNANEAAWMRIAARAGPSAVPDLIGEDADAGMFAMAYLDPADHPVWKSLLRDGHVVPAEAAAVGDALGRIHAATAGDAAVGGRGATDALIHALPQAPDLLRTPEAHPDLANRLRDLAGVTAETRLVLVHGDISPKNILIGPGGPVFLDAECAWYGDPAFDLAFCLNHMLLKCVWRPQWTDGYLACFHELRDAYLRHVSWEPAGAMEARTAALLPGLLLARIDGTSPVEYITEENDKDRVRRAARAGLGEETDRLEGVATLFRQEVGI